MPWVREFDSPPAMQSETDASMKKRSKSENKPSAVSVKQEANGTQVHPAQSPLADSSQPPPPAANGVGPPIKPSAQPAADTAKPRRNNASPSPCTFPPFMSYSSLSPDPSADSISDSSLGVRLHTRSVQFVEERNEVTRHAGSESTLEADYLLVTASLGVLQSELIRFDPPLPHWKASAIRRLGMGCENKVVLQFPRAFWPRELHYLRALDEHRFKFLNLHAFGVTNVLVAQAPPPHSYALSQLSDEEVIEQVLGVLRGMFGADRVPKPTRTRVTRWHDDPYARGSYSYVRRGSSVDDIKSYFRHCGPLHFAGEGSHATDGQTVHGAWMSAVQAAADLA